MKHKDFGGLDSTELQRQIHDSQEQLFRLRFQMGMGQSEGLKKYRTVKKDRARMLTALRAKELGGEKIEPLARTKTPVTVKSPAKRRGGGLARLFKRKQK